MNKLLCAILVFAFCGVCDAATYYVRTDGDNARCSGLVDASASAAPNCAKQTIQAAVDSANPSDTVIVNSGDYSRSVPSFRTARAGAAGQPITVKAALGEEVIVSRIELNHQYTVAQGFKVILAGNQSAAGIGVNASNVTVIGNRILGTGLSAVGISTYEGGSVSDVSINGNILEGRKTIATTFNIGIYVVGRNISVNNNIIRMVDSIERAFEAYGSDITFSKNECYDWIQTDYEAAHPDIFQIFGGATSQNILVEGNYFHDIVGQIGNLSTDGGTKSWIFRNNIFANITSAIFVHIPMEFYNNLFYRCGTVQVHPILHYPGSSITIKNNAFVGCGNGDTSSRGWYDGAVAKNYNFVSTVSGSSKSGFSGVESNGVNGGNLGFFAPNDNCVDNVCYFAINSSSAFANNGTVISGFSNDYSGAVRPQGTAWSIGPYEPTDGSGIGIQTPKRLRIYGSSPE
jgi:hypothetical protein